MSQVLAMRKLDVKRGTVEMAHGSDARVVVNYRNLPFYPDALEMYQKGETTGSNKANRAMVARHVLDMQIKLSDTEEELLYDPQTSGGLLAAVQPGDVAKLESRGFTAIGAMESGPPQVVVD